eukprot:403361274
MKIQYNKSPKSKTLLKVVGTISAVALACAASLYMLSDYQTTGFENTMNLADFNEQVPPGQAVFWENPGYKGRSFPMDVNTFNDALLSNYKFDKTISAMQIGAGVRVKLCGYQNCQRDDVWSNEIDIVGPYNVAEIFDKLDNWTRHVKIFSYNATTEKYVQAFGYERFQIGFAGLFGPGQFDSKDLNLHHVQDIPDGLIATLYKSDYFTGESLIIQGPKFVDFFHDQTITGWSKALKSLQVKKIEDEKHDVFTQWTRVTSGSGPITYTIQTGWSKDEVKKDEKTVLEEFTSVLEAGWSFMGAYAKTTLTNHVSVNIFKSVEQSLHQSQLQTIAVTCDNPERDLVALYQWTLQGQTNGQDDVFVRDSNYICRYGLNANSAPACPLTMCANGQCTECTDGFKQLTFE